MIHQLFHFSFLKDFEARRVLKKLFIIYIVMDVGLLKKKKNRMLNIYAHLKNRKDDSKIIYKILPAAMGSIP